MLANLNISLCPSWSQEEFVVVVVPVELASLPLNNEKEKLQNTDFVGTISVYDTKKNSSSVKSIAF